MRNGLCDCREKAEAADPILLFPSLLIMQSPLSINNNITDGTGERKGLVLILLDEGRRLAGIHMGFDLTFFKHGKWEAKNLFHLRAIKWIPESLAPACRRLFFLFSVFLLPISSRLAPAAETLTFSHKATFPTPESHKDHHD